MRSTPLTVKLLLYRFFSLFLSFTCTVLIYHTRELYIKSSMPPRVTIAQEEIDYKAR
jgi:hypothetical protein